MKHRHEKELKDMEEKIGDIEIGNITQIREIKEEANNVVEKAILDTEIHIEEVPLSLLIYRYMFFKLAIIGISDTK